MKLFNFHSLSLAFIHSSSHGLVESEGQKAFHENSIKSQNNEHACSLRYVPCAPRKKEIHEKLL